MDVGVWIRVSTEMQAKKKDSPETHRERAKYYALAKSWNIVEVYDLSAVSGKTVIGHPETQRMLADVKSGKIKALIFSKLARLARNVKELLEISQYFKEYEASLVSLEENIDTTTASGRLLFTVIGALAEWEREEISSRVAAAVPIRAAKGKPLGGKGPFGYHWVDKVLIPHPTEAAVVKRAFEVFIETKKILTTSNRLNEEGLRARRSNWGTTTLKRLLVDPVYIGRRRANYSKSKGNKKSWVLKHESDWVYLDVEPIIPLETWETVQTILKNRKGRYNEGIPKVGKYAFSGLLVCECGEKMYVAPYQGMKSPRYICKACKRSKINENILLAHFHKVIENISVTPEHLIFDNTDKDEITYKGNLLMTLTSDLTATKNKINKVFDLYADEKIKKQEFSEQYNPLVKRKDQLELEIPRLQGEIAALENALTNKHHLVDQARTMESLWPVFTDDERAKIIQEFVERVTVTAETLDFKVFFLPQFKVGNDCQTLRDSLPRRALFWMGR